MSIPERPSRHGLIVLALLMLGACAVSESPPEAAATFDCGDFRFNVTYRADSAIVTLPDTTLRLPRAISASGARYSDEVSTFWEHQGAALVELADTSYTDCPLITS